VGDGFRQAALDVVAVVRMLQRPDALASLASLDAELAGLQLDVRHLGLVGLGYLGDPGALPAAVEPAIGAAVLQSGGGVYTQLVSASFSRVQSQLPELRQVLGVSDGDLSPGDPVAGRRPEMHPGLHLMQQAFEHGDPLAYAALLRDGGAHVLQVMARHDEELPDRAQEALGLAIGLPFLDDSHTVYGPAYADLERVTLPDGGLAGNRNGTTRGLQQYEPAVHDFLVSRSGPRMFAADDMFPPFDGQLTANVPVDNPFAQGTTQVATFLATHAAGNLPRIIDGNLPFDQRAGAVADGFMQASDAAQRGEVPTGSFVCDALRARYGTDVAVIDSGGLLAGLPGAYVPIDPTLRRAAMDGFPAGPPYDLVKGDVLLAVPFVETAVTRTLTGAELRALLEVGLSALPMPARRFLQVSGLRITYDAGQPAGSRLVTVELDDGTAVIDDATPFTVAMNDFVSDGYGAFAGALPEGGERQDPLIDVVADALAAAGVATPPAPGRVQALP
jgi:hypothetical protein